MIECKQDNSDFTWITVCNQIERFGQLSNYPEPAFKPKAFKELCLAALHFDDTLQLAQYITGCLNNETICPLPNQLISANRKPEEAPSYPEPAPLPATRREQLEEHKRLIALRESELAKYKHLNSIGEDGRKTQTPTRDALHAATAALKSQDWRENRTHTGRCSACQGVGFLMAWELITYRGKSLSVKHREGLPYIQNQDQADLYAHELLAFGEDNPQADRQTVLSAAKLCGCHG